MLFDESDERSKKQKLNKPYSNAGDETQNMEKKRIDYFEFMIDGVDNDKAVKKNLLGSPKEVI